MQINRNNWRTSIERLADLVESHRLTQAQIASASGVDQSQVSRILAGRAVRLSPNVERLCRFEADLATHLRSARIEDRQAIDTAVASVWDGTPAHATAIADIIKSIGRLQSTFHRNRSK